MNHLPETKQLSIEMAPILPDQSSIPRQILRVRFSGRIQVGGSGRVMAQWHIERETHLDTVPDGHDIRLPSPGQ